MTLREPTDESPGIDEGTKPGEQGEDNHPSSWIESLMAGIFPGGTLLFPPGCLAFLGRIPAILGLIYVLGVMPLAIYPRLLDLSGPDSPLGTFLSNLVCLYPLLIPVCFIASILLYKNEQHTAATILSMLPLTLGLLIIIYYFVVTNVKGCVSAQVDYCGHAAGTSTTEVRGTVFSSCSDKVRYVKVNVTGTDSAGNIIDRKPGYASFIEPFGSAEFETKLFEVRGDISNCTVVVDQAER